MPSCSTPSCHGRPKPNENLCQKCKSVENTPADQPDDALNSAAHHLSMSMSSDCTTLLLRLVNKITDLLEKNYSLSEEVRILKDKQTLFATQQDHLLRRIEDLEGNAPDWSQVGDRVSPESVQALVSSVSDELTERKEKELNIVIYGLKEATIQKVGTLFDEGLKCTVNTADITRAFRLGRPSPAGDKPRPVKVFLRDRKAKDIVLDKCKFLSKLPPTNCYKHVYIRPDWSKLQRDVDYKRRQKSGPRHQNNERHPTTNNPHSSDPNAYDRPRRDVPHSSDPNAYDRPRRDVPHTRPTPTRAQNDRPGPNPPNARNRHAPCAPNPLTAINEMLDLHPEEGRHFQDHVPERMRNSE
jgi:hypothetical protein